MFILNSLLKFLTGTGLLGLQADNLNITSGAGIVVGTDQDPITSAHFQRIKLVDGNLNSTLAVGVKDNPLIVSMQNTGATVTISGGVSLLSSGPIEVSGGVTLLSGDVNVLNTDRNVTVLNTRALATVSGGLTLLSSIYLPVNINTFTAGTVSLLNTSTPGLVTGTVTTVPSGTQTISGGVTTLSSCPIFITGGSINILNTGGATTLSGGISILSSTYLNVNVNTFTAGSVSILNTATPGFVTGGVSILSMPAVSLSGGVSILSSIPIMVSTGAGVIQISGGISMLSGGTASTTTGGVTILSSIYLDVNVNTFTAGTVSLLNTSTPGLVTGTVTAIIHTTSYVLVSTGAITSKVQITGGVTVLVAPTTTVTGGVTILSACHVMVTTNAGKVQVSGQVSAIVSGGVSLLSSTTVMVSSATTAKFQTSGGVSTLSSCIVMISSGPNQVCVTGGVTLLSSTILTMKMGSTAYSALSLTPTWVYLAISSGSNTVIWKPVATKRFNITDITINTPSAGFLYISQDTAATTKIMSLYLAAGGGWSTSFQTPWIASQTNHALAMTANILGTTAIYCSVSGYESA